MNKFALERQAAAIEYAQRGWRVLPVGLNKKPINHNGSTGATTDVKQILEWWKENPFANIGIATERASFWVVDMDRKDGIDGWQSLLDYFGKRLEFDTEKYLFSKTAGGGIHFLFKYPAGIDVHNAQGILPGVDIRGDGGYIVVAPSARKIDDKYVQYRWNDGSLPIAEPSEWALELLTKQKESKSQGIDLTRVMTGLSSGERDTELFRYACHLASRQVPIDIAEAFLLTAADRCKPPFSHDVVVDKLKRAYSYRSDVSLNRKLEIARNIVTKEGVL
jgi:hypothetical protein